MCFKGAETASGRCPTPRADRSTPLGPSRWAIPEPVEGSREAGMGTGDKRSTCSETSGFKISWFWQGV